MKLPKAWIRGKLKTDWAPFLRLWRFRRLYSAVLIAAMAMAALVYYAVHDVEQRQVERERQRLSLEQLVDRAKLSAKSQSQLDHNDQVLQDEMRELRREVQRAVEEIRYYRDQMEVIVKTCPGRVRAPNLPWKPSFVSEAGEER
jgi:septal ring factor EnvC (AmiA/AmiB activator)